MSSGHGYIWRRVVQGGKGQLCATLTFRTGLKWSARSGVRRRWCDSHPNEIRFSRVKSRETGFQEVNLAESLPVKQSIEVLLKHSAWQYALKHEHAFTITGEQQECRRSHHAFLSGLLFALRRTHLDKYEIDLPAVALFDPIHDGVHLFAERSSVKAKVLEGRAALDIA